MHSIIWYNPRIVTPQNLTFSQICDGFLYDKICYMRSESLSGTRMLRLDLFHNPFFSHIPPSFIPHKVCTTINISLNKKVLTYIVLILLRIFTAIF